MKKAKLLIIVSTIVAMGLVACGHKPSRSDSNVSPDSGSNAPIDSSNFAPKDPKTDLVKENVSKLENFTFMENVVYTSEKDNDFEVGSLTYKLAINETMKATIKMTKDIYRTYSYISLSEGIGNLTALAESLGISRDNLIKNLLSSSSIQRIDEEKDTAIIEELSEEETEWTWYSTTAKQYVSYSLDNGNPSYEYVRDNNILNINEVKDGLNAIIDTATYSQEKGGFYLNQEQVNAIGLFGDMNPQSALLTIDSNYYPSRLYLDIEEYAEVYFEIKDVGATSVDDKPNVSGDPTCEYNHYYSRYYEKTERGHRLYCNKCDAYLEEEQEHVLVHPDGHNFCTKCQSIINTESIKGSFFDLNEDSSWGYGYKSKDNNRIYVSSFYGSSKARTLRYEDKFRASYYAGSKQLFVFKSYNVNDTQLVSAYDFVNLGYSCMKVLRGAIEIFDNIESYEDTTMTNEQYVTFRASHTPTRAAEVYYMITDHSSSNKETVINACEKYVESVCSICNNVTSSYLNSNHQFDKILIQPVSSADTCHSHIQRHCKVCNKTIVDNETIETHSNASYTEIDNEAYLLFKYGLNKDSGASYVEMNCPTCKKQCLFMDKSPSNRHATTGDYVTTYQYINDKLVRRSSVKMIYPHLGENHICNIEDKVVVKVADLELFFDYNLDSANKVTSFTYDSYTGADFYLDGVTLDYNTEIDGTKITLFVEGQPDSGGLLLGATIAKIAVSADNKTVSVYNASNQIIYQVNIGQSLPN